MSSPTLVVGVAQPRSSRGRPDSSLDRIAELLERASLLRLERDCRPEPALVERADVSPDGLTWRLLLRPALTFHDGAPLDAAATAAVLDRALHEEPGSVIPPGLRDVVRVTAVGARTIDVQLAAPSALLGEALAGLDVRGGRSNDSAAGAFTLAGKDGNTLVLEAFTHYHRGAPTVERVELRPYDSPRTAWAALLRGEIAFLHEVTPEASPFVESSPGVQVHRFLRPFVYVAGFNLRRPGLSDPRVRRALSLAIDRSAMVQRVLDGHGRVAGDPVWPLHWAADESLAPPAFDQARARRELDAAGLPVRANAPGRAGPPARLTFTCLVPLGIATLEGLALAVQRDLLDVGVDMKLEAVALPALGRRLAAGEFDAYVLDTNAFGLSWTYRLWHSQASRPFIDAGGGAVDTALDRVRHAAGAGALPGAVADLRRAFADDPPALFLCWAEAARATSRAFALPPSIDRDILLSLAKWQPAPSAR